MNVPRGRPVLTMITVLALSLTAEGGPPPVPTAAPVPLLEGVRPDAPPDTSKRDAERLERSLTAWADAKAKCGGHYSYIVRFRSAFGFGHATTITVRDGHVVERKFEQWGGPAAGPPQPAWVETGKDVGSHTDAGVAPPRTVDELYAVAKTVVDTQTAPHEVRSLGIDARGLLQHCSIRDTRIADDAPLNGVPPFELTLGAE